MRFLRPLAAVAALGVLAGSAAPARAETLTDLARRLAELRKRVNLWTHLLAQDKDKDKIALYSLQTEDDFKKPGAIQATDLVAIIVDRKKADQGVRTDAAKVLKGATEKGVDSELGPRKKRGVMSKRAEFAQKHLIKWLKEPDTKEGDRLSRSIVSDILSAWFTPSGSNKAVIDLYQPQNEGTWKKAYDAWRDVLNDN